MEPIKTPTSNVNLHLDGAEDLPAERVTLKGPDGEDVHGFQTVWSVTAEEVDNLLGGAPLIVHLWGRKHPPIAMGVANLGPEGRAEAVGRAHVNRAVGHLYAALANLLDPPDVDVDEPTLPPFDEVLVLFEDALRATRDPGDGDLFEPDEVRAFSKAMDRLVAAGASAVQPQPSDDGTIRWNVRVGGRSLTIEAEDGEQLVERVDALLRGLDDHEGDPDA